MDVFLNSKIGRFLKSVNIISSSGNHVYGSVLVSSTFFSFIVVPTHSAFLKAIIGQSTFFKFVFFHCFELEWLIFRRIVTSVLRLQFVNITAAS
jgi:hypothetical protein